MFKKIAVLIPFLGVLFTMTPLAAFADAPSVTITQPDIYVDDNVHNFDNENGNGLGLLDWTCSGVSVPGHDYAFAVFADGLQYPLWEGIDCSEDTRINFVGSIEGLGWNGTVNIVVWDDDILGNDPSHYSWTNYDQLASNIGDWIIATSSTQSHNSNRPI